jgi:hypothetical protein
MKTRRIAIRFDTDADAVLSDGDVFVLGYPSQATPAFSHHFSSASGNPD